MKNTITRFMAAIVGMVVFVSTLAILGIGLIGLGVMRRYNQSWFISVPALFLCMP